MTTKWQPIDAYASSMIHDHHRNPRIKVELLGTDPNGALEQETTRLNREFVATVKTTFQSDPSTLAYRKAREQVDAAREVADKAAADLTAAQAKREELLAAAPSKPSAKQVAELGAAEKRVGELQAKYDDAKGGLTLLERRASTARRAVDATIDRIGVAELANLRQDVTRRWAELVDRAAALLAPLADQLVALSRAETHVSSGVLLMADARDAMSRDLPRLPVPVEMVQPTPQAEAQDGTDDGDDDGTDIVLPLAQRAS